MVFKSRFFTKAGQKERLANVGNVFKSIATGRKVVANVRNKTFKAALEFGANNPFTTAGLITPVGLIGKSVAAQGVKSTLAGVAGRVGRLSTKTKIIGGTAGILAGSAALSAPKDKVIRVAGGLTPESFARAGTDVGKAISGRKSIFDVAKENPVIAATAALAGAAVVGRAALPAVAGAIQSQRQIKATKDLGKSIAGPAAAVVPSVPKSALPVGPVVSNSENPLQNAAAGEEPAPRRRKKRTVKAKQPKITQRTEVNIGNFIKNKRVTKGNGTKSIRKRRKRPKRK